MILIDGTIPLDSLVGEYDSRQYRTNWNAQSPTHLQII